MPLYFANVYPENIDEFATGNAFIYAVIGTASAIIGGILSDKLESTTYWAKSGIIGLSTLMCTPLMAVCLLKQDDFQFSMVMLALHFGLSELWFPPLITML